MLPIGVGILQTMITGREKRAVIFFLTCFKSRINLATIRKRHYRDQRYRLNRNAFVHDLQKNKQTNKESKQKGKEKNKNILKHKT